VAYSKGICESDTGYLLLAISFYHGYYGTNKFYLYVVSFNDSSFSMNQSYEIASTDSQAPWIVTLSKDAQAGGRYLITWRGINSYGYYRTFTMTTYSDVSFGTLTTYKNAALASQWACTLSVPNGFCIVYAVSSTIKAVKVYTPILDAVGFVQAAGTTGQTKAVKLILFPGGVSSGHSGLTPGLRYNLSPTTA
jgi:hypothetical protein